MSRAFTIVPAAAMEDVLARIQFTIEPQPEFVLSGESDDAAILYFAGSVEVAQEARKNGFRGLACIRAVPGAQEMLVDAEGFEGSVAQLETFLRWFFREFGPCRVFDNETGEPLDGLEARELFEPELEFVETTE